MFSSPRSAPASNGSRSRNCCSRFLGKASRASMRALRHQHRVRQEAPTPVRDERHEPPIPPLRRDGVPNNNSYVRLRQVAGADRRHPDLDPETRKMGLAMAAPDFRPGASHSANSNSKVDGRSQSIDPAPTRPLSRDGDTELRRHRPPPHRPGTQSAACCRNRQHRDRRRRTDTDLSRRCRLGRTFNPLAQHFLSIIRGRSRRQRRHRDRREAPSRAAPTRPSRIQVHRISDWTMGNFALYDRPISRGEGGMAKSLAPAA